MGAIISAPLMVIGEKLGLYKAMARRRTADARRSWPSAPASPSAHVREWLAQPGGRRLRDLRRRDRHATRCPTSRRSRSPTRTARSTSSARFELDRLAVRRRRQDHRGVPHRRRAWAGTSTTTACSAAPSASSGPATARNLVAEWIPALDGVAGEARSAAPRSPTSAAATAPRRSSWRRRSRSRVRRLRLPRRRRSSARARRAERGRRRRTASRFEVAAAKDFPGTGYDLVVRLRLPARHGRSRSAPPATCASRSPPTAPG